MEFPNKPWKQWLDAPTPGWATHQLDYTSSAGESHSVWVSPDKYQFFRTTSEIPGVVMKEPVPDIEEWSVEDWPKKINMSYFKATDLQPIEENE
jgi:hypothetical protein